MANAPLEIYRGVMTYNTIALYSNGTKKRFTGFIIIKDEFGNDTSYKINSFRSQVTIQSEALGERGMQGIHCTVHGNFKENTWNGETKWELMAEKIYLDGYEQLAADAEASNRPMPSVPPGSLPSSPNVSPMIPQTIQQSQPVYNMPIAPMPIPGMVNNQLQPIASAPIPIQGGYIYNPGIVGVTPNPVNNNPMVIPVVSSAPLPTQGTFIYNPANYAAPIAPVASPIGQSLIQPYIIPQTPINNNVQPYIVPQTPLGVNEQKVKKVKEKVKEPMIDLPDPD